VKFLITMNMPSRSGVPIHQIICEHPSGSVDDFVMALERNDFLIVDEFYRDVEAPRGSNSYYPVGRVAINHRFVGKVKLMGGVTHAHKDTHDV